MQKSVLSRYVILKDPTLRLDVVINQAYTDATQAHTIHTDWLDVKTRCQLINLPLKQSSYLQSSGSFTES